MSRHPAISVIIPTHNRAGLLGEAIESVLRQTFSDLELIVVDDGSTDATAEVIARHANDSRLRPIVQPQQGRSRARNHGARLARADWLAFLDSDDIYLLDALDQHWRVLSQAPGLGLSLGGYLLVGEHGQPLGERRPWEEGPLTLPGWLFNCFGMPGTLVLRRSMFEQAGGFDPALEMAEDWDLFLRLAVLGCPMAWVKAPVCRYRQHAGSSIAAPGLHHTGSLYALDKLFHAPGLPAEIAQLEQPAIAWSHVGFARRAYSAGQYATAQHSLIEAVRLDPALKNERRLQLLETVLAPAPGQALASQPALSAIVSHLPAELHAAPQDVNRALARIEMAQFFASLSSGAAAHARAAAHLRAGLRRDPRWLFNRGVLAFSLRYGWQRVTRNGR